MSFEDIRQKIVDVLYIHPEWSNKLDETEPSNYGVRSWSVSLDSSNIWIENIKEGNFSFKNAKLEFTVVLGDSTDGIDHSSSTIANGNGKFNLDKGNLTIIELNIECDLDLMA